MRLPTPRGPVSSLLTELLPRSVSRSFRQPSVSVQPQTAVHDEDLQLALWICYELSYRGFDQVDPAWEDSMPLLRLRNALERRWEAGLRRLTAPSRGEVEAARVPQILSELVAADDGPPLAGFLQRKASLEQFREFVVHRSIYHLKEADPHSFAIPRLAGAAKAALVEIQADE